MKKDKKMIKLVIMITAVFISNVFAYDITTGGASGTYIKFGKEIKKYVANKANMDMEVLTSNGSVDNINKMSTEENIRFAIVQHDVINSFRESSNKRSKMLVRNTKVLLPLYYEEIHFVVKRNSSMQFIKDIKNKRINAGKEGSGTFMTTTMLYKEMFNKDVDFNNLTNYGSKKALEELKKGNIEVVVVVSGQPSGTLANLNSNDYKLLKRHSSSTSSIYYDNVEIKTSSYNWLSSNIPTFAVKAYLVTYDTSSKSFKNKMIDFAKVFRNALPKLKRDGHPKWNKIKDQLSSNLPSGWEYYEPFKDVWKYAKCTEDERLMGLCN